MNSSVYSADRSTHLRIVVTALIASIIIVGLAISTRLSSDGGMQIVGTGRPQKIELPNREAILVSPAQPHSQRI
jgi:hypothetical protein